jgi:hypothetical protein
LAVAVELSSPSAASAEIDLSELRTEPPAALPTPLATSSSSNVANLTNGGFVYKKETILQGRIFTQERAEEVRALEKPFAKARTVASEREADIAFGGENSRQLATQVRQAFRSPPFKDFRKSGREILILIEAQDMAYPQRPAELKGANAAFDEVLAAVEAADFASLRIEQGSGSMAEVGDKLRGLDAPLGKWVRLVDGWVDEVASLQAQGGGAEVAGGDTSGGLL